MKRPIAAATLAALIAVTGITSAGAATKAPVPKKTAKVAIKSGVACTTAKAKQISNKKVYICGTNPAVTPATTKLTWLLQDCVTWNKKYIDAQSAQTDFQNRLKIAVDKLTTSIASWQNTQTLATTKLATANSTYPARIATLQAKIDATTAKAANAHTKADTTTVASIKANWVKAAASYDKALKLYKQSLALLNDSIARLQATKDRATQQIATLKAQLDSTNSTQSALLAQVKGNVTDALVALKAACAVGQ